MYLQIHPPLLYAFYQSVLYLFCFVKSGTFFKRNDVPFCFRLWDDMSNRENRTDRPEYKGREDAESFAADYQSTMF